MNILSIKTFEKNKFIICSKREGNLVSNSLIDIFEKNIRGKKQDNELRILENKTPENLLPKGYLYHLEYQEKLKKQLKLKRDSQMNQGNTESAA